jgi:ATP-dependent Clp protease ATP-binding subunit ClpB
MTSNIGSSYLLEGIDEEGNIEVNAVNMVNEELKSHFRPEFINRLDEIIMFKPLTKDNIANIVDILMKELNERISEKGIRITLSDKAKEFVTDNGFDPVYGARPLKRFIQKKVETLSARLILKGDLKPGDEIIIDVSEGDLVAECK